MEDKFTRIHNPFEVYRPELMVDDIVDYFIEPHFYQDLLSGKPIMLVGAKGTGKTTLFEYLSYSNQKKVLGKQFINRLGFLGIYWKVDINYVSGFYRSKLSEEEWTKIFGHYINLTLCLKLCDIVMDIQNEFRCIDHEEYICKEVSEAFYLENKCTSFEELYTVFKSKRNEIEKYVNNVGRVERPILSMIERGHQTFCDLLSQERVFKKVWFFFLIDEYENLLEYQQKIVNTLIKHSKFPYSFKVCRRSYGAKTYKTLNESEALSDPADYTIIDISMQMADKAKFKSFAKKVCEKRLEKIPELKEFGLTNIDFFLPGLKPEEEAKMLEGKKTVLPYQKQFEEVINNDLTIPADLKEGILKEFLCEPNPIVRRLCLSILQRGKIKAFELIQEYRKYGRGEPSKFSQGSEWIHNNEIGILFLICSEYKTQKMYCGFDIFVHLSWGIIRYVLELCYVTFNNAIQEGFIFSNPMPIDCSIQNKAARFVADKHLSEINTYAPYGEILKTFALSIGRIFEYYHKEPKQSEPERNQFTTDIDQLNSDVSKVLQSAVMWSILLEVKGTKHKNKTDIKNVDYCLHPIFSPRFQISPYQGRKIEFSPTHLKQLIFEGEKGRREVLRAFIKEDDPNQLVLFELGGSDND